MDDDTLEIRALRAEDAAGDVLRLQRPRDVSSLPPVATEDARKLLAYVVADRDGVLT